MKHYYKNILIGIMLVLPLTGCEENEPVNSDNFLTIRTTAQDIEHNVKSIINLDNDMIYAYPFSLSDNFKSFTGIPLSPVSITENVFTYNIPEPKADILFTNITDGFGNYDCVTSPDAPQMTISIAGDSEGCDSDCVFGYLSKNTISDNNDTEVYPIELKRIVAEASIRLRAKRFESEELITDLSEFISKIELSVDNYASYAIDITGHNAYGSYSGKTSTTWTAGDIPEDSIAVIAKEKFIFPSCDDGNPLLTLKITYPSGNTMELKSSMKQKILQNKHYNLLLTLRQRSDAFDFNIESIDNVYDTLDFDHNDLVPLSITPAMMDIDMTTRGEAAGNREDFNIGSDDLYCYCFSSQNDSLIQGYPKKQKYITNSTYHYQIPKGDIRLVFANFDLTQDTCDYIADANIYSTGIEKDFTCSNMGIGIKKDGASSFLVIGKTGNIKVGNDGYSASLELKRISTGYNILLDVQDSAITDLDTLVSNVWIELRNLCLYYNLSKDNFKWGNNIHSSAFETDAIPVSGIKPVERMDGKIYFECLHTFLYDVDNSNPLSVQVDILTKSGMQKRYQTSIPTNEINLHNINNIIITIPSSQLQ